MIRIPSYSGKNEIYRASQQAGRALSEQSVQPQAACGNHASDTDKIQISSEGSFKSVLAEVVRKGGKEVGEAVSPERLAALRGQLSSGSYDVSPEKLAEAMLARAGTGFRIAAGEDDA